MGEIRVRISDSHFAVIELSIYSIEKKKTCKHASILSDSGVQASGVFILDSCTGELRVSGQLDADVDTGGVRFYTVNITARDSGSSPLSTVEVMQVNITGVNDNPPVLNMASLEVWVYENVSIGDGVLSLTASDVDGDNVTFVTSDTILFEIDDSVLRIKQQLDYETERCHTITIRY